MWTIYLKISYQYHPWLEFSNSILIPYKDQTFQKKLIVPLRTPPFGWTDLQVQGQTFEHLDLHQPPNNVRLYMHNI